MYHIKFVEVIILVCCGVVGFAGIISAGAET